MERSAEERAARNSALRAKYGLSVKTRRTAGGTNRSAEKLSVSEKLVLQFIICGFIMVTIMLTSFINSVFVEDMRQALKETIQNSVEPEGFSNGLSRTYRGFQEFSDNVKTIFGREEAPGFIEQEKSGGEAETTEVFSQDDGKTADFRIDEDMLDEINNREDLYIKQNFDVSSQSPF